MALREVLADLSVRVRGVQQLRAANANISEAVTGLRGFGRALGVAGAAISSALAVRQLSAFVGEMIHAGDELDKTSQQLSMSVRELQRWRFAADRAGVDAHTMSQSIQRLARSAFEASRGSASQASMFRTLGINVRAANGQLKSTDVLMREVTEALARMEDRTAAAAIAQRIMGRTGAQLMPLFNAGAEGLDALNRRFDELGGGLSQEMVESAAAAQDAMTDFGLAMQSLKSQLAVAVLPTITRVVSAAAEWGGRISQVLRRSSALQVVLGALVVAAGLVAASLLIIAAPVLVPLTALFLLVEDIVTMFRGGQSVIGHFIDELFGVGSAQAVVDGVTSAFEWLVDLLRDGARFLGLINEESGQARRPRTPEEREAMRFLAKEETTPDGAERRNPRRRQRERERARRTRITEQLGGMTVPLTAEALRPSTTIPVTALGARGGGDVHETFNFQGGIHLTAEGVTDPAAFIEAVRPQVEDHISRAAARAASRNPQGRGRGSQ